jgi:hypothetical protein
MASRLASFLFIVTLSAVGATLAPFHNTALAAGLDQKGTADAKEATQLYKQGRYEDAAQIFAKLSLDYPDMEVFERNLGACFYYLRQPEPALSNLRHYLSRKKDITPDDKSVVDRWIDEMESLRAYYAATNVVPATGASLPAHAGPGSLPEQAGKSDKPAGVDLKANPASGNSAEAGTPIYKTWWFWTGAVAIVAAGTVTAILLAGRSSGACDGASMTCVGVK